MGTNVEIIDDLITSARYGSLALVKICIKKMGRKNLIKEASHYQLGMITEYALSSQNKEILEELFKCGVNKEYIRETIQIMLCDNYNIHEHLNAYQVKYLIELENELSYD